MESVQQIQIVDVRREGDKVIADCTMAVFLKTITNPDDNFLARYNSKDLIRSLELSLDINDIELTSLVHVLQTDRAVIPFAVIVSVCSVLIVAALVAFCIIGQRKGKPKGELASGWFLSVFRPTILGKGTIEKNTKKNSNLRYQFEVPPLTTK